MPMAPWVVPLPMSACGTKQTLMPTMSMSASGGKADMTRTLDYVS
jgi:hypothetical protein